LDSFVRRGRYQWWCWSLLGIPKPHRATLKLPVMLGRRRGWRFCWGWRSSTIGCPGGSLGVAFYATLFIVRGVRARSP
jgi:hypothetical protein